MSGFIEVAKDAFRFLVKDYGFSLEPTSDENSGDQVLYRNVSVGVGIKVLYDFSSAFIFVFVYRLVDGELIDNALPITDDTPITCFDFNDMLGDERKMKPAYEYGEESIYYDETNGLKNFVVEFADRLKNDGAAVLGGDFSRLPEVETKIKMRARTLYKERR